MAAADQPLGAAAVPPRHLGPYMRRLLGQTLPGEFSMKQLNQINQVRRAQGLPPVGGKVGFNTPGPGAPAGALGQEAQGPVASPPPSIESLLQSIQGTTDGEGAGPGGFAIQPGGPIGQPLHELEGDVEGGHQANVRNLILARMQGVAQHATSNQALQRYLRFGKGNVGQRPILPPRRGGIPY